MDTRNTVTTLRKTPLKRLDGALSLLNVLKNPISFHIIDYLNDRGYASPLDLLIHTGTAIDELELLLESLSIARIIEPQTDILSCRYRLNIDRLEGISYGLLAFSLP